MRLSVTTIVLATLALSGCSVFNTEKQALPPCPRVSVLAEASKLTQFRAGVGRDVTDVEVQAQFASYSGSCEYNRDTRTMTISMQVGIDAQRGPAARGRDVDIAYFIAIPTFYPKPEAKAVFPVALKFPQDTDRVRYTDEKVEITIPIAKLADLAKYEVFVGLQLDSQQLDYNRQHPGAQ
jgi:hypothetical protein